MPTDVPGDVAGLDDTLSVPPDSRPREPDPESTRRIGPYRLLHLIGEGGMGEVWVAEQLEPVRRKVALKVIKAGMDTKQVVARFEAERQALALMDHPAIAKVLDGGSTPEGRPYFVMEYVPGVSLTEHCDTHRLPTEERLKLFIEVCEGVQHAHQKAIIHRDLKPSNILVSLIEGRVQPKIIDFGIAKATGQRLTEKTLFTEVGAVIGTPEYMSPEQADLTGQDIDTRTDVYSLGVILYQILTGELPLASADLRSSSYEELRRKLREVDPPRPSTRLATLGEGASEAARKRETDPGSLRRQLEGDLDAITMKALEKDRARRYGTPSDLAADLRRYLHHEPVLAQRPSRAYRFRKYARRHRLLLTALGGVVTTLAVGVLATTLALVEARKARAEEARQRELAMARLRSAQTYADKLFLDIAPQIAELPGATAVRTKLAEAGSAFLQSMAIGVEDDPQLRWQTARMTLGLSRLQGWGYGGSSLGDYTGSLRSAERAQELLRSLPPDFPTRKEHLDAEYWDHDYLQAALQSLKRYDEALQHIGEMEKLARSAESELDRSSMVGMATARRANVLSRMGRREEAIAIWREGARNLDSEVIDPTRATAMQLHQRSVVHGALGHLLLLAGEADAAITEIRLALHFDELKAERFPNVARYKRDLADDSLQLGLALLQRRDVAEGEKALDVGVTQFASMATRDPANAMIQTMYLNALERAAEHTFSAAKESSFRKDERRALLQRALRYWEQCRKLRRSATPGDAEASDYKLSATPGPATPSDPEECGANESKAAQALLVSLGTR